MKAALSKLALPALHLLPPEAAHSVALKALNLGLGPANGPITSPRLATRLAGLSLPNPVGLAAGFDKTQWPLPPCCAPVLALSRLARPPRAPNPATQSHGFFA